MEILNIAAYQFAALPDVTTWRAPVKTRCVELGLKGTILLTPEGINLFLAGLPQNVSEFLDWLRNGPLFEGKFARLTVKESYSDRQPFNRMLVKLKKEIITMRHPTIRPDNQRAPAIAPRQLKQWLDQGHDDQGREIVLLDTRNAFEVEVGTFEAAREFNIHHFGEFPHAVQQAADHLRDKTVVTFCTGGIRCEKAVLYMQEIGMDNVLQLDGGILKYFEDVGGAHWRGDCFVFDDRVALNPQLQETSTRQCYACRAVVTAEEQQDARYVPGHSCPQCATTPDQTSLETRPQAEAIN